MRRSQQSYSLVDVAAASLATRHQEAEMLFQGEENCETVTNVAAMLVFGHASVCHGREAFGQKLLNRAQEIGVGLGLFGVSKDDPRALQLSTKPVDWVSMTSPTAWGAFNYFA